MSTAIEEWARLRQGTTAEVFAKRYPFPFLLRKRDTRAARGHDDMTDRVPFVTGVVAPGEQLAPVPASLIGAHVMPLVKAPGNPFLDRISVGRATNCDVVIRESSVSKLHAHFQVITPGDTRLTDAKSANGTRINGRKLAPLETVRATSGDLILFGVVLVQLLSPEDLHDLLGRV